MLHVRAHMHTHLWPSSFAFDVLRLLSVFLPAFENACAQAHHMCYGHTRAHPFFFALSLFSTS